jgi:hypothetical protein
MGDVSLGSSGYVGYGDSRQSPFLNNPCRTQLDQLEVQKDMFSVQLEEYNQDYKDYKEKNPDAEANTDSYLKTLAASMYDLEQKLAKAELALNKKRQECNALDEGKKEPLSIRISDWIMRASKKVQ